MKKQIFILTLASVSILISSCSSTYFLRRFDKKNKFSDNKSVLGLNAINADNNYYTRAILDYLLVKKILEGNSLTYFDMPNHMKPIPLIDTLMVQKRVLFPQLQGFHTPESKLEEEIIKKLQNIGVKHCIFDIPTNLNNLKSGFQFNHYVFRSSNRAALQAFGIVNSEVKESSLYIVTDYIQYQDFNCTGIPTIRYAVGMRAEFKIQGIESESELKGIGSLAGLAAQVETNRQQVNITIKTIGITGIESRLTIPSNTTFDVKTYSDYEKVIDFIRNLRNSKANSDDLIINPQIIPVMDEYRTTIEHTLYPMMESIEVLETKLKGIEKEKNIDKSKVTELKNKIIELKLKLIEEEVSKLIENRISLIASDEEINNYSSLIELFKILNNKTYSDEELRKKFMPQKKK